MNAIDRIKGAYEAGNYLAIVEELSGNTNHIVAARVWSLAMSAWFGRPGLHPSRVGADGRPSRECCEDVPEVFDRMASDAEELGSTILRLEKFGSEVFA